MEQELKYFTPSIEDIHVGYECEISKFKEWTPTIITWDYNLDGLTYCMKVSPDACIRVPYLTKEQIEKEGWKKQGSNKFYEKHKNSKIYYLWVTENRISINEGMFGLLYWKVPQIYRGECKDINTFRYVCKLLGV